MPFVYLLFSCGCILLAVSLRLSRRAGNERRKGKDFQRKAGYAFGLLLLASVFFLGCLFYFAYLIKTK